MAFQINNNRRAPQAVRAIPDGKIGVLTDPKSPRVGNSLFGNCFANMLYVKAGGSTDVTLTLNDGTSIQFSDLTGGNWVFMPPFKHIEAATASAGIIVGLSWE